MHDDQVEISTDTVTRLVAEQFPSWTGLPVQAVVSGGTVNALFRLGADIVLRFPLQPSLDPEQRAALAREQASARRIADHVPLPVPEPLALGAPGEGYPGPWSAYRWIPGETASLESIADLDEFAGDLAGFVTALQAVDTQGQAWDGESRGGPLSTRDESVRRALAESAHLTDGPGVLRQWERCLTAAPSETPTWIHADLMPGNLLVRDGRLCAVIDIGELCVGDPAVDLMPAWNLLPRKARETYRQALGVDDDTWERGRGWAVVQAAVALPYYVATNPGMAETARHTLAAVLD